MCSSDGDDASACACGELVHRHQPHPAAACAGQSTSHGLSQHAAFALQSSPADALICANPNCRAPDYIEFSMQPWSLLDTTSIPGSTGTLRLMRRGAEFSIMLGDNELMNSRVSGSETALATLTCERLRNRKQASILIGGLGMGFTLRAAQALLPADAGIVVAELVPGVVEWAKGPLVDIFGESLADPRVTLREADVGDVIRARRNLFDAILLDVDNGPDGLTREANTGLYSKRGLAAARAALRDGGMLAVWSANPDADFTRRLSAAGFDVEMKRVRANGSGGGARHVIWTATVDGQSPTPSPRRPAHRTGMGRRPSGS
jgi:spermidine synthase